MAATEVLPAGNEWEFSKRNYPLHYLSVIPGPGRREFTQPTGLLQEIVEHVQVRFIREEWQFAALVQDLQPVNGNNPRLITVFTHPSRAALVEALSRSNDDITLFIKPGAVGEIGSNRDDFYGYFPTADPINQILKGTNLITGYFDSEYNMIAVKGKGKNLFWQTGVGFLSIDFRPTEQSIPTLNSRIEKLMEKVRPLQEEREVLLALQTSNPIPLFQTE